MLGTLLPGDTADLEAPTDVVKNPSSFGIVFFKKLVSVILSTTGVRC